MHRDMREEQTVPIQRENLLGLLDSMDACERITAKIPTVQLEELLDPAAVPVVTWVPRLAIIALSFALTLVMGLAVLRL
jgi:hypothetical protein